MATFGGSDDLRGARFVGADLRAARFVESDLSGVVMRGVEIQQTEIDAPWLPADGGLRVNDVDVGGYVEAELNRRFPGRSERRAADPEGLRSAWATLQQTWATTVDRAASMPAGTVDISVAGEWSFAQTLRHLVLATDTWLGRGVLEIEQPFHPIGQQDAGTAGDGADTSVFRTDKPSYDEVLQVRAERVAMVTDFLTGVTVEELAAERKNPHAPQYPETVRSCLHVILEEEWEHLRFAVRDLDAIAKGATTDG
ncbi:Pentapeptide repeat-containing protein [Microlunatus soli]|uniref:Pentapeptide repeat-containing protein n=2 Tax=Microlunatus soli TaxID=630515 RepID=A0A1H1PRC0_9ACTN|nr:Pentapeptide repeat-containing protein [Microlunatus soli]